LGTCSPAVHKDRLPEKVRCCCCFAVRVQRLQPRVWQQGRVKRRTPRHCGRAALGQAEGGENGWWRFSSAVTSLSWRTALRTERRGEASVLERRERAGRRRLSHADPVMVWRGGRVRHDRRRHVPSGVVAQRNSVKVVRLMQGPSRRGCRGERRRCCMASSARRQELGVAREEGEQRGPAATSG
jgi:hypothetical protein